MRAIKTADGNCYYIINGEISDARGSIQGFLTAIPMVKFGQSVKICYSQKDSNGDFIRDDEGMLKTRVFTTAPVVA